uniref:Transmembrane protein n=1 Tax=Romanomermis culicivorax TaxID=13658 RepID=A0A915IBD3_ROMCU
MDQGSSSPSNMGFLSCKKIRKFCRQANGSTFLVVNFSIKFKTPPLRTTGAGFGNELVIVYEILRSRLVPFRFLAPRVLVPLTLAPFLVPNVTPGIGLPPRFGHIPSVPLMLLVLFYMEIAFLSVDIFVIVGRKLTF